MIPVFSSAKATLATMSLVTGSFVCIAALFIPPQGEIDQSVLIAIGQFLVFAATLLGVADAAEKFKQFIKKHDK